VVKADLRQTGREYGQRNYQNNAEAKMSEHGFYIQNGVTRGYRQKITEKQFKDKKFLFAIEFSK